VIVGASGIAEAAASNNVAKGVYAYSFSDQKAGLQCLSLLMSLALGGLTSLIWLLE
jgi:hypothetical protein